MRIVELAKLSHSQAASVAAYRGSLALMERGWLRFPPMSWNATTLAAMDEDRCAGVICYTADEDDHTLTVRLAYVEPEYRSKPVFAGLASHLRKKFKGSPFTAIDFVFHEENEAMRDIVQRTGAKVLSHEGRVAL